MAVLTILKYGDPFLRRKCEPVKKVGPKEKEILDSMSETMQAEKGIGLAATQVGIDKQFIVVNAGDKILKLVNPKIIKKKGTTFLEERCLSVPGIEVNVKRSKEIELECIDEENRKLTIKVSGLLSHVFQHEIDHLYGKMIIDKLGLLGKLRAEKKLKKIINPKKVLEKQRNK